MLLLSVKLSSKNPYCFFGQHKNNETKTNYFFLSLFVFKHYKSVLSGSFFIVQFGGGGGGGIGRWVLIGVFSIGTCPKINLNLELI